ncbi:hypothetical protein [Sciscionella marina]|uniref:hypothetical protein n=1 Tax=Sciscionella marina TaxID=508770 RepID=UPI00037D6D40|nr:hypothetical protein [Sciscionella marina]
MGDTTNTSPVARAPFADGADRLVWNPHLSPAHRRRARWRALAHGEVLITALAGASLVTAGITAPTGAAVLVFVLGGWTLLLAGLTAFDKARPEALAPRHAHGRGCRLASRPGEFFYRSQDFTGLGEPIHGTVCALIDAVDVLHTSPARAWLDPGLPRQAHLLVWETLRCLDLTRHARALAEDLAQEPGSGDLAARVRDALTAIDREIEQVCDCLDDCVTLARVWEAKLRRADLAAHTETTLAGLPEDPLERLHSAAEQLSLTAFAHITAARDISDAGPFAWENPTHHNPVDPNDPTHPSGTSDPGAAPTRTNAPRLPPSDTPDEGAPSPEGES